MSGVQHTRILDLPPGSGLAESAGAPQSVTVHCPALLQCWTVKVFPFSQVSNMLHLAAWNLQSSSINSGLNFEFKIKVEKLINLHTPANFVGKTGIQNKKIQSSVQFSWKFSHPSDCSVGPAEIWRIKLGKSSIQCFHLFTLNIYDQNWEICPTTTTAIPLQTVNHENLPIKPFNYDRTNKNGKLGRGSY